MARATRVKANGVKVTDKRKIKSKKTTVDGVEFDSLLEGFCYRRMKEAGIKFVLKPKYEIIPKFKYNDAFIRPMIWTPDFYIPELNLIVETKGRANESFPLRLKIFMWIYSKVNGGDEPGIVILETQKEVSQFVLEMQCKLRG